MQRAFALSIVRAKGESTSVLAIETDLCGEARTLLPDELPELPFGVIGPGLSVNVRSDRESTVSELERLRGGGIRLESEWIP